MTNFQINFWKMVGRYHESIPDFENMPNRAREFGSNHIRKAMHSPLQGKTGCTFSRVTVYGQGSSVSAGRSAVCTDQPRFAGLSNTPLCPTDRKRERNRCDFRFPDSRCSGQTMIRAFICRPTRFRILACRAPISGVPHHPPTEKKISSGNLPPVSGTAQGPWKLVCRR